MDPLGNLIDWIAAYGVLGLFAVGLAERFLPALPSYGLLVAIGVLSVEGAWTFPIGMAFTTIASFLGAYVLFLLSRALGQSRSTRFLYGIGRMLGLSTKRIDAIMSSFRAHERTLIVTSQLVPTVRLIAPMVAGLLHADAGRFAIGTIIGISTWNGLFIAVGHFAAVAAPGINTSALAIQTLVCLIVGEIFIAFAWRMARRCPPQASVERSVRKRPVLDAVQCIGRSLWNRPSHIG